VPTVPDDQVHLLDEELNRLSARYRDAVVLCELEGRPRKEAARLLGIQEGTLSSRLAAARKMLAERLTRRGVTLSGTLLVGAVCVPPALAESTVRAAMLVAAGVEVTATAGAVALMRGVQMSMFLAKLKVAVAVVLVLGALGIAGFTSSRERSALARADPPPAKPQNELERLRRENELLKLNLEVVLEKVRAQETELRTLKDRSTAEQKTEHAKWGDARRRAALDEYKKAHGQPLGEPLTRSKNPVGEVENALKALRAAPDKKTMWKAAEQLERATKQLQEHMKQGYSIKPQPK
jgi:hypothetical protein